MASSCAGSATSASTASLHGLRLTMVGCCGGSARGCGAQAARMSVSAIAFLPVLQGENGEGTARSGWRRGIGATREYPSPALRTVPPPHSHRGNGEERQRALKTAPSRRCRPSGQGCRNPRRFGSCSSARFSIRPNSSNPLAHRQAGAQRDQRIAIERVKLPASSKLLRHHAAGRRRATVRRAACASPLPASVRGAGGGRGACRSVRLSALT